MTARSQESAEQREAARRRFRTVGVFGSDRDLGRRSCVTNSATERAREQFEDTRVVDLVEKYADPPGTGDARVVALAGRLGVTRVATLDTRHFSVVRPRYIASLTLLP